MTTSVYGHKAVNDGHYACTVCGLRVEDWTKYVKTMEGRVEHYAPRTHTQHAPGQRKAAEARAAALSPSTTSEPAS
jgi:hypothetical protein